MPIYHFCPYCGQAYDLDHQPPYSFYCNHCQKYLYINLNTTASAVVVQDEKLLLVRRAIDPHRGLWDTPGGYCQPDEHPRQTVQREVQEELGVDFNVGELFGIYAPTPYEFAGQTQWNCDLFYLGTLASNDLHPADDVATYAWCDLRHLPAEEEIAFRSVKQVVSEVVQKYGRKIG